MTDGPARKIVAEMRKSLSTYDASPEAVSLDRLVGRLSGAIDALTGQVDDSWLDELRSAWWPLEYVNASVLSDDRTQLTQEEADSVSRARDEFLLLLTEY